MLRRSNVWKNRYTLFLEVGPRVSSHVQGEFPYFSHTMKKGLQLNAASL
jgi:hypothetical protein